MSTLIDCFYHTSIDGFSLAALGRLKLDLVATVSLLLSSGDLGVELELHALLLEGSLEVLGDFTVNSDTTDRPEELDSSDLGSESAPDRTKFKTNDTTANNDHSLGDLGERESSGGRDNGFFVDLDSTAGEWSDIRASSEEGVLGVDGIGRAISARSSDLVWSLELAVTGNMGDTILLEEMSNTAGQGFDGAILGLHNLLEVELDAADLDTSGFEVLVGHMVEVRVLQKRFRGDATNVQAGATESIALLDANGLEAELCGLDSSNITAGTTADDGQIGVIGGQSSAKSRKGGFSQHSIKKG